MRFYSAFLLAAVCLFAVAGCKPGGATADSTGSSKGGDAGKLTKLTTETVKEGTGDPVKKGDDIWVKYTGRLANRSVFDSNTDKDDAFHVTVGESPVIKGWNEGLVGVKKGGKYLLKVPFKLGYGERGQEPKIPPMSDLYFDIEVTDVLKAADAHQIVVDVVKVGTGREAKSGDTVNVSYTMTVNGKEIENSKDKKPTEFKIGADKMVIPGFDDCVIGMKEGGVRRVQIPPQISQAIPNEAAGPNVVVIMLTLNKVK